MLEMFTTKFFKIPIFVSQNRKICDKCFPKWFQEKMITDGYISKTPSVYQKLSHIFSRDHIFFSREIRTTLETIKIIDDKMSDIGERLKILESK
jgi:hypothetical protein